MLKTVGGKRAVFSGREPGIYVPAPRMLKNKQFSPSVQFIFSVYLIDSSIIILFNTFVRASGHRFTCPVISRKLRIVRSSPDDLRTSDILVIIFFQPQFFVISRVSAFSETLS
jgi:hypothetical protein